MTRHVRLPFGAAVVTLAGLWGVLTPLPAQQERVVGVVLEIVAPVFLRAGTRGAEVALDPKRDVGRVLLEGQALRAGAGGRVTFSVGGQVETLSQARGRFELRYPAPRAAVVTAPAPLTDAQERMLKSLMAYGRPGGSRGVGSAVFAPADQGVVRLDSLEVRWTPRESPRLLTAELRTATGRVAWSMAGVAGSTGRLTAAANTAIKDAIRSAEGADPGVAAWTIVLREENTVVGSATFRVLSTANDRVLSARLRALEAEADPLLRAIGRAFEFADLGLFNDAADEFERILPSAPQSEALLRAAISAHDRTGNLTRAQALREQAGRR